MTRVNQEFRLNEIKSNKSREMEAGRVPDYFDRIFEFIAYLRNRNSRRRAPSCANSSCTPTSRTAGSPVRHLVRDSRSSAHLWGHHRDLGQDRQWDPRPGRDHCQSSDHQTGELKRELGKQMSWSSLEIEDYESGFCQLLSYLVLSETTYINNLRLSIALRTILNLVW